MKILAQAVVALVCLAVSAGFAEQHEEAPPRYAVEVLVFRHLDQSRATAETEVPPDPYAQEVPAAALPPTQPPIEFLLLDPLGGEARFDPLQGGALTLRGAWSRLDRLDAYQPLAYFSWSQLALGQAATQSLGLADLGVTPPGLNGEVKLYKERFLHLALDLSWQESAATVTTGDRVALPPARIEESRRLRGDLVQYFDNPRFGALAYVRELESPEAAAGSEPDPTG